MRILSLLPSATEIVYALGLGNELVGVSHECDYPPEVRMKPVVSKSDIASTLPSGESHNTVSSHRHAAHSLYRLDQQLLRQLAPDLILTQELCTVCAVPVAQVREAARILAGPCQILSLEPQMLAQILDTISAVGEVTGHQARARHVVQELQDRIDGVAAIAMTAETRPTVCCVEWLDPLMAGGHWIPEMVQLAGGIDGLGTAGGPSRVIPWERVAEYRPQVMVIMPCGYKVARTLTEIDRLATLPGWYGLPAVRDGRVYIADSPAYFSRPGPRIVAGLEILAEILHPELLSGLVPSGSALQLVWEKGKAMEDQTMSKRFVLLA